MCFDSRFLVVVLLFPLHVYTRDPFATRNFGWFESSRSEVSFGPFIEESDSDSHVSVDDEASFARHEPVLKADHENVDMQREF